MTTGLSGTGVNAGDVASAILKLTTTRRNAGAGDTGEAVVVPGCARPEPRAAVVAAVCDDATCGPVLRYAAAEARRRSVPLRVVHVWGGRGSAREAMCDADRLLSAVLYDHLGDDEAAAAEREIRHDDDPARALCALSSGASLLVVAARGDDHGGEPLGHTVQGLIGATRCPLAVLPPAGG
ncbi:universal stress protein [Actinoplanes sp. NPDC049548]|uniref:universal stress protein n=1 Tax=Actinoplanes sp. NPDC049548 TaxID=3155152 RepID=UPI0034447B97